MRASCEEEEVTEYIYMHMYIEKERGGEKDKEYLIMSLAAADSRRHLDNLAAYEGELRGGGGDLYQ